ncbi:hypothetical protein LOK49_LG02G01106 [Camellia lanceoleosa]|uniref:Uncharacterized protein n=1 Tax=Camellia lanceoleosa TaxID=1840588 RepID=A0ACC0IK06_9ERIC|nr:hypothetical protein LOK49_LG02G01106 [Camellia lanceoleosa]
MKCYDISSSAFISEATTTNGRVLISFQLGAFVPGYPVHPVIVRYPHVHFDQFWGNIASGKLMFRMFIVSQFHGGLFRRPRGMYFSAKDKGEMMSMIYNWPGHQVDMIVLTEGSRILGLGDLGVQGTGIPIGKLDMSGINPQRIWDFGNLGWKERSIYQLLMNLWRQFTPDGPRLLCSLRIFK